MSFIHNDVNNVILSHIIKEEFPTLAYYNYQLTIVTSNKVYQSRPDFSYSTTLSIKTCASIVRAAERVQSEHHTEVPTGTSPRQRQTR